MSRINRVFLAMCLFSVPSLADFSNDVTYIAEECLTMCHFDAFRDSLLVFAKDNHLSDAEMADRLLCIAANPNQFNPDTGASYVRAAISGLYFFPNAENAVSALEQYLLLPQTQIEAIGSYGKITSFDNRFFSFISNALETGKLDKGIVCRYLYSAIRNLNADSWKTSEQIRLRMCGLLIRYANPSFDSLMYSDRFLAETIPEYSNSIDHVSTQGMILDLLAKRSCQIAKYSCYRGEWGNISDEEWYRRATNACQTEIARVMALPENERLNMTAILDARIAAIEAAEARAARHAAWKRRLRLGALVLPVPVIALAAIVALTLRRRRAR